jgi:hypothetical protein
LVFVDAGEDLVMVNDVVAPLKSSSYARKRGRA